MVTFMRRNETLARRGPSGLHPTHPLIALVYLFFLRPEAGALPGSVPLLRVYPAPVPIAPTP